jgi:rhamnogalacturonyl hydrolase YesR
MIPKNLHEQVFENAILKGILEQIENPKEKEKTIKAIQGLLDQMQGKFNGLSSAYEEIAKKQGKE